MVAALASPVDSPSFPEPSGGGSKHTGPASIASGELPATVGSTSPGEDPADTSELARRRRRNCRKRCIPNVIRTSYFDGQFMYSQCNTHIAL
eukprot:1132579-Prorocentrum_minimum.AAC.1